MAIVLLLIGTNLRASRVGPGSRSGRGGGDKKHVVELTETGRPESKLVRGDGGGGGGGGTADGTVGAFECEEEVADV